MTKTPLIVHLTASDGNIFTIVGETSRVLKQDGYPELAIELKDKILKCQSYDKALALIQEYVEVI